MVGVWIGVRVGDEGKAVMCRGSVDDESPMGFRVVRDVRDVGDVRDVRDVGVLGMWDRLALCDDELKLSID
jgi:hypothetical protein